MDNPVVAQCAYCLSHVPGLVRYGSKPWREIRKNAAFNDTIGSALRCFDDAVRYPPNQVFIGSLTPTELAGVPRPWFERSALGVTTGSSTGPLGELVPQALFFAALKQADVLQPTLVDLCAEDISTLRERFCDHPVLRMLDQGRWEPVPSAVANDDIATGEALALHDGQRLLGCARGDRRGHGREDHNLDALTLLEALSTKASASIALASLLVRNSIAPQAIDFIISCGEEAAGDRYQRGGGGMAKAIGEMCGCGNASGMDVKNFCAAPASALVTAGAMVKAGLFERVAVVAGGSLAKLGMKSQAFLDAGMPILGDVLGSMAFLVTRDDGSSPILRLDPGAVGIARIGASTADDAVYRQLVLEPLNRMGLSMHDVDKFAPELHNPEIMEHSGAGDVVTKNYRMLAALAVLDGVIAKSEMGVFIERIGMVGFAPPQGHIPSGVPFIGHAMLAMRAGLLERAMFVCKASLFLNRLTELYDGVSFVLERNPGVSLTSSAKEREVSVHA